MATSSIRKQLTGDRRSPLAHAIGVELRRRRLAAGLTQSALGDPFSRAFVCAVERGHAVPSIASLLVLTDRLGTPIDEFFQAVKDEMTQVYNAADDTRPDTPPRRR